MTPVKSLVATVRLAALAILFEGSGVGLTVTSEGEGVAKEGVEVVGTTSVGDTTVGILVEEGAREGSGVGNDDGAGVGLGGGDGRLLGLHVGLIVGSADGD